MPKRKTLIRIGIALFVVGLALLLLPPYDEYCHHAEANQKYCAAHKAIVATGVFFEAYNGSVTALATVLLTFVTWGLVSVAREQTRTTQAQLRAYVFPQGIMMWDGVTLTPPVPARANQPGVSFSWQNTGQTPAINVVSWGRIAILKPQNERLLKVPLMRREHANTLGAQQSGVKHLWYRRALTPQTINDIYTGRLAIYFYGRIEYEDVFGTKRWTDFRFNFTRAIFPYTGGCVFNVSQHGNKHY